MKSGKLKQRRQNLYCSSIVIPALNCGNLNQLLSDIFPRMIHIIIGTKALLIKMAINHEASMQTRIDLYN